MKMKKQNIYYWASDERRKEIGMNKVYPTFDIFVVRDVKNVHERIDTRVIPCYRDHVRRFGTAKIGGAYVEVWQELDGKHWYIS